MTPFLQALPLRYRSANVLPTLRSPPPCPRPVRSIPFQELRRRPTATAVLGTVIFSDTLSWQAVSAQLSVLISLRRLGGGGGGGGGRRAPGVMATAPGCRIPCPTAAIHPPRRRRRHLHPLLGFAPRQVVRRVAGRITKGAAGAGAGGWRLRGMDSRDDGGGGAVAAASAAGRERVRFLFCVRKGYVLQSVVVVTVVISANDVASTASTAPRARGLALPGRASLMPR